MRIGVFIGGNDYEGYNNPLFVFRSEQLEDFLEIIEQNFNELMQCYSFYTIEIWENGEKRQIWNIRPGSTLNVKDFKDNVLDSKKWKQYHQ